MVDITSHYRNANQNNKKGPLHTCTKITVIKKWKKISVSKDVEKSEPCMLLGGLWNGAATVERFGNLYKT